MILRSTYLVLTHLLFDRRRAAAGGGSGCGNNKLSLWLVVIASEHRREVVVTNHTPSPRMTGQLLPPSTSAARGILPRFRYLSAWFCPYAHRTTIALEHHADRVEYEWIEVRALPRPSGTVRGGWGRVGDWLHLKTMEETVVTWTRCDFTAAGWSFVSKTSSSVSTTSAPPPPPLLALVDDCDRRKLIGYLIHCRPVRFWFLSCVFFPSMNSKKALVSFSIDACACVI